MGVMGVCKIEDVRVVSRGIVVMIYFESFLSALGMKWKKCGINNRTSRTGFTGQFDMERSRQFEVGRVDGPFFEWP